MFLRKNNQITASLWSIDSAPKRHSYLNHKPWPFCVSIFTLVLSAYDQWLVYACTMYIMFLLNSMDVLFDIQTIFVAKLFFSNHFWWIVFRVVFSYPVIDFTLFNTCYVICATKCNYYAIYRAKTKFRKFFPLVFQIELRMPAIT